MARLHATTTKLATELISRVKSTLAPSSYVSVVLRPGLASTSFSNPV